MKKVKPQKQIRLKNMKLIQGFLTDESDMTGHSNSQIIEDILIDHFLPLRFRSAAIDLYMDCLSIGDALVRIWSEAANLGYGDLRSLVEYAKHQTIRTNAYVDPNDYNMPLFLSLLESLLHYIDDERDTRWLKDLIVIYGEKDGPVILSNIYQIVLNNWKDVKDYAKTYNLLQAMAQMQPGWRPEPGTRRELIAILKGLK